MARRANPSIAPTSRRPRMHIFGIHNPALQRLHPLLNYLLNPLRMRFIRWQRAHIIAPIRRAVKTRDQVSRHPWPRPVRTPRIFRRQAPPRPILHLVIDPGRDEEVVFIPLIPLEEARYSSRYCPQARPGAPQAAPRADRAPMQSRARLHPTRRKIIEFKPVHVNPNPISKLTWAFANRHAPDLLHAGVVQIGLAQNNAHPFLLLAQ